jgi:hypothetical protein
MYSISALKTFLSLIAFIDKSCMIGGFETFTWAAGSFYNDGDCSLLKG